MKKKIMIPGQGTMVISGNVKNVSHYITVLVIKLVVIKDYECV